MTRGLEDPAKTSHGSDAFCDIPRRICVAPGNRHSIAGQPWKAWLGNFPYVWALGASVFILARTRGTHLSWEASPHSLEAYRWQCCYVVMHTSLTVEA